MSSFEEKIQYYLGRTIIGRKQGDKLTAELKANDAQPRIAGEYILRLNRVRTHPKVMVMQKHTYEYVTKQSPEIGQAYTYETDFPGRVESISDEGVTIRTLVTPGTIEETPFGPGRISEDGDNYKMEIDARKGALVRMAGLVGRIIYVDDKAFHIDFGNPFGGETLICDVTVEKIAEEKTAQSGK
jgi:FKBP-type peptidyl-prolyl cis-trans isomerase 2